jgi:hypothetical protein
VSFLKSTIDSTDYALRLSELLFEIGSTLGTQGKDHDALTWLRKAYDSLGSFSTTRNSTSTAMDAELAIVITHHLVKALLTSSDPSHVDEARDISNRLQNNHKNIGHITLLKLQIIDTDPAILPETHLQGLLAAIDCLSPTDAVLDTLVYMVHRLRKKNRFLAHSAMEALLRRVIARGSGQEYLERTLTLTVWSVTTLTHNDGPSMLIRLFNELDDTLQHALNQSATHTVQLVNTLMFPVTSPLLICRIAHMAQGRGNC